MNFVPILPLAVVVFPGEALNLRLSNRSAIQLIKDCLEQQKPFGIVLKQKEVNFPVDFGTACQVVELVKTLKNGSIYVRIAGQKVFRILEAGQPLPDKKYKGAIVEYPRPQDVRVHPKTEELIVSEVKRLYKLLHLEKKFPEKTGNRQSFDFAHKIGFSLQQEYELLTIHNEIQRMEYIRRHLNAMKPVVLELEAIKKRIQMNGHFRNLS